MRTARPKSRLVRSAALLLLMALSLATPAGADIGETIIQRCVHGQPLGGFSQSAYSRALKDLTAETEEYSNCSSLIRQAQLAAAGGGAGSLAAGVAAVPIAATPAEQRAITRAAHGAPVPVQVGGQVIHPGVVHVDIASALSSLPTPLLAAVAFLLACLLVIAGGALRNRVRARRPD